jgi:hypothetical protein
LACQGGGGIRASDGKPTKKDVLLEVLEKRRQKWEEMDEAEANLSRAC